MSHELDKTFNAEQNRHFRKVTVATKITRKEEESHGTQLLTAQRLAAVTKHIHHLSDELPWKKIFFLYIRYLLSERPNKLENRRFALGLSSFFCTFHIKMLILGKHDHAQHRKLTPAHLHQQPSKNTVQKAWTFSMSLSKCKNALNSFLLPKIHYYVHIDVWNAPIKRNTTRI